jgi:2-enoate reductase
MVNPAMGREREYTPAPAPAAKRVVVVGGGPGGMEAARVSAGRGHRVTLYERGTELGGQLLPAGDAGYKRSLRDLRDQMAGQLAAAGVEVVLGRPVTAEDVLAAAPDAVVLATGAVPAAPPLPGLDRPHAVQVVDLHTGQARVGERVVVAGGGLNGCDAAVDFAERGHRVTLVDRNPEVGRDLNHISRGALLARLAELGVEVLAGTEVVAVVEGGAEVRTAAGELRRLPADTVALALGARADNALVRQLKGRVRELYALGDCLKPRKIGEAVHEGHRVGLRI